MLIQYVNSNAPVYTNITIKKPMNRVAGPEKADCSNIRFRDSN